MMDISFPDWTPEAIRKYCTTEQISIRQFCLSLGRADNWLKGLFDTKQSRLNAYGKVADFADMSLEALRSRIEQKEMRSTIDSLILATPGCETRADLARRIGISKGFLQHLYEDTGKLNGLKQYIEIARKIGCQVDELRNPTGLEKKSA